MRHGMTRLRNLPLFPLIPLLPIAAIGGCIALGVVNFRRLRRIEQQLAEFESSPPAPRRVSARTTAAQSTQPSA